MLNVAGRDCVLGVDISTYQGNPNFQRLALVRDFVYFKAGGADGSLYGDNKYQNSLQNTKANGIPGGAYYFMHGMFSGAQQGNHFCDIVGNYDLQLPPALDVEHASLTTQHVSDFIAVLNKRIGQRWTGPKGDPVSCIIYTGKQFENIVAPFGHIDLWLAAYTNPNYPSPNPGVNAIPLPSRYIPKAWSNWSIWQYAGEDGRIDGVSGACDQDVATKEWYDRVLNQHTGDWLDMIDEAKLEEIIKRVVTSDEVLTSIAAKVGFAESGDARVQGHSWAPSTDLRTVIEDVVKAMLDQLDPNRGVVGPAPGAKAIRTIDEDTNNKVNDILVRLTALEQ